MLEETERAAPNEEDGRLSENDDDEVCVDVGDVHEQLVATCEELKQSLEDHAEQLKQNLFDERKFVRTKGTTTPPVNQTLELNKHAVVTDEETGLKF